MSREFTDEAKMLWEAIPQQIQERLIANVWCPNCGTVTTITDFKGYVENGDLVLIGSCAKCGKKVARVLEGG
jgi:Zn ribbon nucleic-acid-binding protein